MQESPYLHGTEHLIEKFKELPLLGSLDKVFLKKVIEMSKLRKFEAGEIVTAEGVKDFWIYIILSGEVAISKHGEEIVRLRRVGDTFGEVALIDGESRSATVRAISETVCLAVDAYFLDSVKPADRNAIYAVIYRLFAELLSSRLRTTSEELVVARKEIERLKKR